MTIEEQVGARLVFGIPGKTITPDIVRHFKETHCGGLMLYRINFESPDQLRKLISDLETAIGRRLLVCTDHEGGRVIMFREGVTIFPSNQALGATGDAAFARSQGEQEGKELRRLGIDVNFAPNIDVLTDAYSPNIGIRSYGKDAELVAKMGAQRISAMQVEGVSACAKHFPGLGPATLDPHLNLPTIDKSWDEMEKVHLVPFFRAMRTAVHSMMTSHVLYPTIETTPKTPATFSRKIVHDYLRQKIGYKGVIFSDDLEMGAIKELCSIGEAAVKTVAAGHDMVLACHDQKLQREVYDALVGAYKTGQLAANEMDESLKRIANLTSKRQERFAPLPATAARADRETADIQAIVSDIARRSVTIFREGPALSAEKSTTVIFPRLSSLAERIMIETPLLNEATFLSTLLADVGMKAVTPHVVDIEPAAEAIQHAVTACGQTEQVILFVYDAHIYPSNKALLDAVLRSGKPAAIILLRDVYDAEFVPTGTLCLSAYGFRVCDLQATVRHLFLKQTSIAHA